MYNIKSFADMTTETFLNELRNFTFTNDELIIVLASILNFNGVYTMINSDEVSIDGIIPNANDESFGNVASCVEWLESLFDDSEVKDNTCYNVTFVKPVRFSNSKVILTVYVE